MQSTYELRGGSLGKECSGGAGEVLGLEQLVVGAAGCGYFTSEREGIEGGVLLLNLGRGVRDGEGECRGRGGGQGGQEPCHGCQDRQAIEGCQDPSRSVLEGPGRAREGLEQGQEGGSGAGGGVGWGAGGGRGGRGGGGGSEVVSAPDGTGA